MRRLQSAAASRAASMFYRPQVKPERALRFGDRLDEPCEGVHLLLERSHPLPQLRLFRLLHALSPPLPSLPRCSRNGCREHFGDLTAMVSLRLAAPQGRGRRPGPPHANTNPSTGASSSSFRSAHVLALPRPPNASVPFFQRTSGRRRMTELYSSRGRSGKFSSGEMYSR